VKFTTKPLQGILGRSKQAKEGSAGNWVEGRASKDTSPTLSLEKRPSASEGGGEKGWLTEFLVPLSNRSKRGKRVVISAPYSASLETVYAVQAFGSQEDRSS